VTLDTVSTAATSELTDKWGTGRWRRKRSRAFLVTSALPCCKAVDILLHFVAFHCIALRYICISSRCISFVPFCFSPDYISLHFVAFHCTAFVTLRYVALCLVAFSLHFVSSSLRWFALTPFLNSLSNTTLVSPLSPTYQPVSMIACSQKSVSLQCFAFHSFRFIFTWLHLTSFLCFSLHFFIHYIGLRCILSRCISLHLHCTDLQWRWNEMQRCSTWAWSRPPANNNTSLCPS